MSKNINTGRAGRQHILHLKHLPQKGAKILRFPIRPSAGGVVDSGYSAQFPRVDDRPNVIPLFNRDSLYTLAELGRIPPAFQCRSKSRGSIFPLEPDKAEAAQHLAMLDPAAKAFTFQNFDDNRERKKAHDQRNKERKRAGKKELPDPYAHTIHGTLERRWDELVRWNEQGAGVFITVNEATGTRRTKKSTIRVRAVFNDLDGSPLETGSEMAQAALRH